jgi:hypothetical protein
VPHDDGVAVSRSTPQPYAAALLAELEAIEADYLDVLACSEVRNVDPNRHGSDTTFYGFASWGWAPSDSALEATRMRLLGVCRLCRVFRLSPTSFYAWVARAGGPTAAESRGGLCHRRRPPGLVGALAVYGARRLTPEVRGQSTVFADHGRPPAMGPSGPSPM